MPKENDGVSVTLLRILARLETIEVRQTPMQEKLNELNDWSHEIKGSLRTLHYAFWLVGLLAGIFVKVLS